MALEIIPLAIPEVKLVRPRRFDDSRGFFSETYNAREFAEAGLGQIWVQDNHSSSMLKGTIRGFHFQAPPKAQAKLVRVARGHVLDVVVDIRRGSPSFGRHVSVELSAENWNQILVPEGFAHCICTLEPNTEVLYKVSDFFAPERESGLLWNDPALAIAWPDFAGGAISPKDRAWPALADLASPFEYAGAKG